MPTQIQIKRGSTTPSGLTVGEKAVNTSTNQIYMGGTGGTVLVGGEVTGGVDMGAGSAVSANRIPTQSGVYNYARNNFVGSFNGNTGAVTGASLGANTFTGLNTFNAGVTTSFLYASTGSTFGSTLQVNGGATFAGRVDVGGILDVAGGTTFDSTTDHGGVARFASGVTISGTLNGATATFSRLLSAPAGISTQAITSRGNSLLLAGLTSGAFSSGSQIILPVADAIQLNGYGGAVALSSVQAGSVSYNASLKFMSEDTLNEIGGSVTLTPPSYTDGDYTLYLPNTANGTLALTSQLMGTVNGSTAATTAVTSFNGRTGAVQGVSSAAAGTGISVSAATGAVTITNIGVLSFNGVTGAVQGVSSAAAGTGISVSGATGAVTITNTGVQSFNGATGAVTGASLGANTFTALNTFNAGISSAGGTFSALTTFTAGISASNVARTNVNNSFSTQQTVQGYIVSQASNSDNITIDPTNQKLIFYADTSGNELVLSAIGNHGNQTIEFPLGTTRLAGLASNQTFTGTNTFTELTRFTAGISAAGATLSSNITIPSGSTLTVNGNFVANGNVNLGDATSDSITVAGLLTANAGVSAAGGTFSALTQFTGGITTSSLYVSGGVTFGGTVASDTGYRITSNAINAQTGTTYTFLSTDNGKIVTFNNGSAVTVTIPSGLPVGFNCTGIQLGAGQVGFTAASGVTMNAYASAFKISGQHGAATVVSYTTNIFNVSGTLSV